MTITIGRKTVAVLLVLLLAVGGIVGSYFVGRSSADADSARSAGYSKGKAAGKRQQAEDDLGDQAKQAETNAKQQERDGVVEFLGYDDWKDDH